MAVDWKQEYQELWDAHAALCDRILQNDFRTAFESAELFRLDNPETAAEHDRAMANKGT